MILDRPTDKVTPLSADAHSRLRSGLGKVAWLSQTRQDIRAYVSLIATQQSSPSSHTEDAMRSLLRYLKGDMKVVLKLPHDSDVPNPPHCGFL